MDCSEEVMGYRLTHKRGQPELLTDDMRNWLKFLRNQAKQMGVEIIDTTKLSNEEVINVFKQAVDII